MVILKQPVPTDGRQGKKETKKKTRNIQLLEAFKMGFAV